MKPIEERIFKALGHMFGHVTVMKGMDTDRTAAVIKQKWDMFTSPVAVGLDASRFDQHVSLEALRFEHQVYLECFKTAKHKRKLANILKMQENNRCVGRTPDGELEYVIEGTRMSGDMNTSLGNCVLMCSMIKAYALHKGINLQLANNGDDCVVFMEKRDLKSFSDGLFEWFLQLGFNMAIEPPSWSLEEIEFCQCRPVYDGTKYTMCRNPLTAIAKDSVYLKSTDYFATYNAWLDAVGTGGIALAGGLPVFNSFYSMYKKYGSKTWYSRWRKQHRSLEGVDDVLPWFMRQTGLQGRREARSPTPESRASFYYAWGVTPDEQVELEKYYDTLSLNTSTLSTAAFAPRRIFVEPEDCL
nr:RNA polymerase [Flumine tombus-like virus 42]